MEEAHPEAASVLREAGLKPHDAWGVFTTADLVMAGYPSAAWTEEKADYIAFYVKPWAVNHETPEDAAAWLATHVLEMHPVASEPEPEETPAHEAHEETGAEGGAEAGRPSVEVRGSERASGEEAERPSDDAEAGSDVDGGGDALSADLGAEILDADFFEEGLTAPDLEEDYGAQDLLTEGSDFADVALEPEPQGGAFIFGDNLHQLRTSAIGLVVQISLAKQEAIWAQAGAGPDEYSQLMSAVVRDTVDGTYKGDQTTYDRFVALSTYDNAARRVQVIERERVNMLTTADRATIEAFDPQADWP